MDKTAFVQCLHIERIKFAKRIVTFLKLSFDNITDDDLIWFEMRHCWSPKKFLSIFHILHNCRKDWKGKNRSNESFLKKYSFKKCTIWCRKILLSTLMFYNHRRCTVHVSSHKNTFYFQFGNSWCLWPAYVLYLIEGNTPYRIIGVENMIFARGSLLVLFAFTSRN